ncbi:MAG: hypothetical protein HRU13_04420 [Phycisphaerales bacterium]|nr:hypothetical protein [Phycisphaerales bacterium]
MPDANTSRQDAGRWPFLGSVALALISATVLITLGLALPEERTQALFDESGPFEQASPWLWITLSLWIPLVFRKPTIGVAAGMVIALAAAAREWDWHVAFTGYSVLKPPFYYRSDHTIFVDGVEQAISTGLPERILAAAIMLLVVASVAVLVSRLIALQPWKRPWAWWVLALGFAFGMLVFTKVIDRAPALLDENLGITLGPRARQAFYAIEEGLEMMLPFFFAAHALALARWHRARKKQAIAAAIGAKGA